jgi:hypothetical protein
MSELHWTAEETRKGWGIRYNPTPGGVKNANGTTSFSLSFIALELTDMVSETEAAAKSIARELNCHADLVAALREIEAICTETQSVFNKRMGTRVGNCLVTAQTAIARAEGR